MATTEAAQAATPRVAVIGAGGWGRNLVRNLHELGALHAVVEVNAENLRQVQTICPDVPTYTDTAAALADPQLDAVAIATPVATHYEVVRQALEADKDVFVEKPLTPDPTQAWHLVERAEQRGRLLMVGHLLLFQPAIQWLRDDLAAGRIGQVHSIHQERLGLGRARDYENALWCLGTHDVAVQRLLLPGRTPRGMQVHGQCILQPGIEDDVYLHLNYDDGLHSHLHCSWLWPEKRRNLVIVGSEGMVVYDEINQVVTHHRKGIDGNLDNIDEGAETIHQGHGQPLRLELEHFLDCLRHGQTCQSDGRFAAGIVDLLAEATGRLRNAENA
ncbi:MULTISPECIES: Gfo/Idh/MocA family protein [unclassified Halorhodospira]|uniref:Gfo/Idh/MocA family protein n=1 Tax=unclassified Halorhodospira TaxID=2626748 RepID=UPI001EE8D11D|nr:MULTISPECIES: Gfo/Idh/MocA family oxidoreductase [unclassified Halorhodospira]MCG5539904.1 Gfo/Idh/MocA family oxidoreductase [Halorhodospira sp. M39old]MCG5545260.1 Gfo/Idh/MocA family oxidoreductase [Halorhodospira sp. M38]